MKSRVCLLALILMLASAGVRAQQTDAKIPFASEVAAFKHTDSVDMPKPGGILFIGSSSIRKWTDLPARFPDKPIISRGLGGSKIAEWVKYYMPLVVYPYKPSKIFIYVGDNDIAIGASAETVYNDFVTMLGMIRQNLGSTKVYFMAIKLSPSRAKYYEVVNQANQLIINYIKKQKDVFYMDVNTPLLNAQSLPDSSYFQKDMLHLNTKGYDKWQDAIKKYVK